MASAQVLSNSGTSSRKQEHLEAGKRRLEEFRKKKAAEWAKKAASSSQLQPADTGLHEKQYSESEHVQLTDSDGAVTSDGVGGTVIEPYNTINNDSKATEIVHKTDLVSSYDIHAIPPFSVNNNNVYLEDPMQTHAKDEEFRGSDASSGLLNVNYSLQGNGKHDNFGIKDGSSGRLADGIATEEHTAFSLPSVPDIDRDSSQYSYGLGKAFSNASDGHPKDFTAVISHVLSTNVSPERTGSILLQNKSGYNDLLASGPIASYEDSVHRISNITDYSAGVGQNIDDVLMYDNHLIPDLSERKISNSVDNLTSASIPSLWPSESRSMGFSFDIRSSSDHVPPSPAIAASNTRRSRPSFLDSINAPRVSLASFPPIEPGKAESYSSKVCPTDVVASSTSQNSMNSLIATGNGGELFRHGVNEHNLETKHNFYSTKQDEDFAALEQHIEDLTQEKFSLQRTIEASRALADSLAAENSALTDSYNQQGSVVCQLKFDMERLQEEIKAQLVELESMKNEYANVLLECNAADERAKLLASEVIGLEEKALRLRSTELKLERQLENSQYEISSYQKKISSLEKERQDLQLTIDALQEEKKLLQSKLRKASASGKFVDVSKSSTNNKDVSTSTEDLVDRDDADITLNSSNLEMHATAPLIGSDASSQPENRQLSLEGLSLNIPPDQTRMIQNINALISELALEKEVLMQALSAESSRSSTLKDLNKELSRKLEVQTQRLELLTTQSMANDNIPVRQPDSRTMHENTAYADEGDEVVERVLGWIMKLFPGGPSRRRTSKLL